MQFRSKWGFVDSSSDCYTITRPDTPRPWDNYIYGRDGKFQIVISQRGLGPVFYICEKANLVSRGRNYCLVDKDSGQSWSLTGFGVTDEYACRHYPGRTEFYIKHSQIESTLVISADLDQPAELARLIICNHSTGTRRFVLVGSHFTELDGIGNDHQLEKTRYNASAGALLAQRCHYGTAKYKYASYYMADKQPKSYCGSYGAFLGSDVSIEQAEGFKTGVLPNVDAHATKMIQALSYELELRPKQEYKINFIYGLADNFDDAENQLLSFRKPDLAIHGQMRSQQAFDELTVDFIKTPDEKLNLLLNKWTKVQLHRQVITSRFSFLHNWRNNLQDAWGWMIFDPTWARYYLKEVCQIAKDDGFLPRSSPRVPEVAKGMYYLYQRHNDIATWAGLLAGRYAAETGDLEFFYEKVAYAEGRHTSTVIDCLINGIRWLCKQRGKHGMVLLLDGDWSDPLEEAGRRGIGESPWTSVAFVHAIKNFAPLLRKLDRDAEAKEFEYVSTELVEAVNRHAWDGQWYIRGITDDGIRFGVSSDDDARISLLMQAWAIIAGVVPNDRMPILLGSIDKHIKTSMGPILYSPPFMKWRPNVGRESAKQPGTGENGSCYIHAAMMLAVAEVVARRPDEALKIINHVLPLRGEDCTDVTNAIPLWIPNFWHGPHSITPGLTSGIINTGAAAWLYQLVMEGFLGIKPTMEGLEINPCLPSSWDSVQISRKLRETQLNFGYVRNRNSKKVTVTCNSDELSYPCILQTDLIPNENCKSGSDDVPEFDKCVS
ncbi:MAG: hypothetical protein A2Y12_09660 [Planctomycetes bacterium GWF2_42_9]|nr:MAG: hypothetical protein A2Y12_09660 [Planctomycetes bacterium GWF2_42_9]